MSHRMAVDDWRAMIDETEAQSNAEPVACAIANRSNELGLDVDGKVALHGICQEELERALYTAPPRPDASAGLIEAAEYLKLYANDFMNNWIHDGEVAETLLKASEHLRARAADRSGKP